MPRATSRGSSSESSTLGLVWLARLFGDCLCAGHVRACEIHVICIQYVSGLSPENNSRAVSRPHRLIFKVEQYNTALHHSRDTTGNCWDGWVD